MHLASYMDAHVFTSDVYHPGEEAVVTPCIHKNMVIGLTVYWPNKIIHYVDHRYHENLWMEYATELNDDLVGTIHWLRSGGWGNTSHWRHTKCPSYSIKDHFNNFVNFVKPNNI